MSINRGSLREKKATTTGSNKDMYEITADDPSAKLLNSKPDGPTQHEIDTVEAMLQREKTHW